MGKQLNAFAFRLYLWPKLELELVTQDYIVQIDLNRLRLPF